MCKSSRPRRNQYQTEASVGMSWRFNSVWHSTCTQSVNSPCAQDVARRCLLFYRHPLYHLQQRVVFNCDTMFLFLKDATTNTLFSTRIRALAVSTQEDRHLVQPQMARNFWISRCNRCPLMKKRAGTLCMRSPIVQANPNAQSHLEIEPTSDASGTNIDFVNSTVSVCLIHGCLRTTRF